MAPTTSIPTPRLLLADDHYDLLCEVRTLLQMDFEVIGVARDGLALIDIAADLNPDVVITDFRMPGPNGIAASSTLLQRGLCKAVVLLTEYGDGQLVDGALQAGIRAVVFKIKATQDLIPAIQFPTSIRARSCRTRAGAT